METSVNSHSPSVSDQETRPLDWIKDSEGANFTLCNLVWGYFNSFWRWICIMEREKGEGKTLYKGSAGSCRKLGGNSHNWGEQLINPFNLQVPGGQHRFCFCFYCCDVSVSKRNQLPLSSSSMNFCNLLLSLWVCLRNTKVSMQHLWEPGVQFSSGWWRLQKLRNFQDHIPIPSGNINMLFNSLTVNIYLC